MAAPLEIEILRYLTENWSDRIDRIDRIVLAAGLASALQPTAPSPDPERNET
jgi:hypothetical protein